MRIVVRIFWTIGVFNGMNYQNIIFNWISYGVLEIIEGERLR